MQMVLGTCISDLKFVILTILGILACNTLTGLIELSALHTQTNSIFAFHSINWAEVNLV